MELNNKQKKYLRTLLNSTDAKWQIGKNGITDNFCQNLADYLEIHEVAKVKLLQSFDGDKNVLAEEIAVVTNSLIIQIVGKQVMLFKPNKDGIITRKVKAQ